MLDKDKINALSELCVNLCVFAVKLKTTIY